MVESVFAGARQVVLARELQGFNGAYFHTRSAQTASGEVQFEVRDRLLLVSLLLDAINDDTIARTGLFTGLARDAQRFACDRVAHEDDVAAVSLGDLQSFMG